jgi:hypothetical protein
MERPMKVYLAIVSFCFQKPDDLSMLTWGTRVGSVRLSYDAAAGDALRLRDALLKEYPNTDSHLRIDVIESGVPESEPPK